MELQPPKAVKIEVVATQPSPMDARVLSHLRATTDKALPEAAYVVKIQLEQPMPAAGMGWALYVGEERIPKYFEYTGGIYFTTANPKFFADHRGKPLRFSLNGEEFVDTGLKLEGADPQLERAVTEPHTLPAQRESVK